MKIFFVFNPKAGQNKIKTKIGDIIELYSMEGHQVTIAATTKRGDATELTLNLSDDYDRVICAGGDGTLDEVIEGMSKRRKKISIGYIPAGSTNDYAVSLGLPVRTMDAAKTAISEKTFFSDMGGFNDKTFVYVAAFGLFTDVSYETPQNLKNRLGHAAYILEGIKKLNEIKSYKVHVETDTMKIDDEFLYGMVTNSESVGGFKKITGENIELNDGLFEVTLFKKPRNPIEVNEIINALLLRDLNTHMIYSFKSDHVIFTSEETMSWTLDGEFGGDEKEVVVTDYNKAFEIAVK